MEHLSKAIAAVSRVGEVISRTAQSAQEMLRDQELRSKGIQTVITGAQTRFQGFQNGIVQRAGRIQERLLDNRRQLQTLLQNLEERFNASQRAWQLQARRRDRVDVQFGRQVIENAPQEIRARLWYVLLENPHLAAPLKCEYPLSSHSAVSDEEVDADDLGERGRGEVAGGPSLTRGSVSSTSSRFAAAAAAALGFKSGGGGGGGSITSSPSATSLSNLSRRDRSVSGKPAAEALQEGAPQQPQQPQPQAQVQPPSNARARLNSAVSSSGGAQPPPGRALGAGASAAGAAAVAAAAEVASAAAAAATGEGVGDSLDGWELISGVLGTTDPSGLPGSGPSGSALSGPPQPEAIRIIMERLDALGHLALDESGSDPVLVAQQAVLEAMSQVPWEAGVGLPAAVAPDCRFALLNEMTAGQEEVDDSILRDIHRTFPEHPYFGMEAGQRSLFRVLKAYSLHDLEVAYCQGMAFMAGVLLMYVPEETAFRLFCRLMDPEGPNLRRLYLPGLEPLKAELATFELLLTWRMPELAAHLSEYGLPPVLYVSQWLMTLFATPFPPAFCARVIDVLLQDGHDRLLLRCSYAVVEALEPELLARHDFEALITYLKMEPVTWPLSRQRAIMDRALVSPLTDADIDIARETVANRKLLAAALATGGAIGTAGTASTGGAGPSATAAGELLGGALGAATAAVAAAALPDPSAVMHQRQRSLEAEVDAALTVAAAAQLTAAEGVDADGRGRAADWGGAERRGAGASTGAASGGCDPRVNRRDDLISFDEDGGAGQRPPAGVDGARCPLSTTSLAASAAVAPGTCTAPRTTRADWEPEWGPAAAAAAAPHQVSTSQGAGAEGCSSSGAAAGSSYGMSPSLLDDLDFSCGAGAAGGAAGPKGPELEYGEYGEMLMDAGVLLPELGAGSSVVGAPPSSSGAAAGPSAAAVLASDLLLD